MLETVYKLEKTHGKLNTKNSKKNELKIEKMSEKCSKMSEHFPDTTHANEKNRENVGGKHTKASKRV